jgi:hypothetical protein
MCCVQQSTVLSRSTVVVLMSASSNKKRSVAAAGAAALSLSIDESHRVKIPKTRNNTNIPNNYNKSNKKKKRKLPTTFLNAQSLEYVVGPYHELVTTPVASDVVKEVFLDRLVKEIVQPFLLRRPESSCGRGNGVGTTIPTDHGMIHGTLVAMTESTNSHPNNHPNIVLTTTTTTTPTTRKSNQPTSVKERIVMGTNQCSRLLERVLLLRKKKCKNTMDANSKNPWLPQPCCPSLIILAKDTYPPTMLAHVPVLAQQLNIPVLLLPGKASIELGQALNVRLTSIVMFLPKLSTDADDPSMARKEEKEEDNDDPIDSFVAFIKSHIMQ